ncbi:TetR/AcrR family transcriptional regulator C-terminal domain-containing protein [Burkholderia gladioli]|uniref:TetR/AcrR family transcriptional regulator C-terminal domain-containing protein n=1 Tax=Burkholderia gladioli TaxID=28095 RepID=UPI00163DF927|nr:TetR/AcrR family transcriptional regulator C-terminal domain-containing protein [Burkholderia gladioli]
MTKLNRDAVIAAAFDLLDEVGLDRFSTRHLAKRLNVEQPALYWHFKNKADLMSAMAEAAMARHRTRHLPGPDDDWRRWFVDNMLSFRSSLLAHRDGARLHAGSRPEGHDLERLEAKLAFLIRCGLSDADARRGLLAASRYTVGSVLEEQAEYGHGSLSEADRTETFSAGILLLVAGLASRLQ